MLLYMLKRLGLALLVALAVSLLAYMLVFLSGDPALALAGEGARQADIDMVRKTYGLDRPVLVHCQTGNRAAIAASLLRARGLSQVLHYAGGFAEWRAAGHPVEQPAE